GTISVTDIFWGLISAGIFASSPRAAVGPFGSNELSLMVSASPTSPFGSVGAISAGLGSGAVLSRAIAWTGLVTPKASTGGALSKAGALCGAGAPSNIWPEVGARTSWEFVSMN